MDNYYKKADSLPWFKSEEPATIEQIAAFGRACAADAFEEAANEVPTNWLHHLLTGPKAVKFPQVAGVNPAIERLLRGVKAAIQAKASALRQEGVGS